MRKVLISILIGLLLIGTVFFMVNGISAINIEGIKGLSEKDNELEAKISELSELVSVSYSNATKNLKSAANSMQEARTEYENQAILSSSNASSYVTELEPYDIDYLWTKIGNYAKDENVVIKIELVTNGATEEVTKTDLTTTTKASCTLNFTTTGAYSDVTDFIYDIENDSKLGFKIDSFAMSSSENNEVVATFSCTDIPVILDDTVSDESTSSSSTDSSSGSSTSTTNSTTTNSTTNTSTNNTANTTTNSTANTTTNSTTSTN